MLHEIFYWLLNMSITAVLTGAVVLLLRKIRKIPRRVAVYFWLVPFLRMSVPVGLNYPYSLMSILSFFRTKNVVFFQPVEGLDLSMTNRMEFASSYFPVTYQVDVLENVFSAAGVLWLIGAAAIWITLTVLYITTLRELKDARHIRDNVYCWEKITSPAVYGIFRTKIVLPSSCRDEKYVLLHENAHIRGGDNLWRMIGFGITAVHWFNPFAWIFLRLFLRDLELACDERVVQKLEPEEIKAYAHSLLENKRKTNVFVSAFGGAAIRTRVENILSFRKITWLSAVGFAALVTAVLTALLTNAP